MQNNDISEKKEDDNSVFKALTDNLCAALNVKDDKFEKAAKDPELLNKIMVNLSKTVKEDENVKFAVFFTCLSSNLPEPLNLFVRGPSSSGKTYGTVQTTQLFPDKDVMSIGAASPKFLIRQRGVLVDRFGNEISLMQKPDRKATEDDREAWKTQQKRLKDSKWLIDLSGSILLFLESPNLEVFNILRPILSHDKEEIAFPYVDKTSQGQIRTVMVVVKGWPATIFLNANDKYIEELATRSFTISPIESSKKYEAGNKVTNEFASLPWEKDQIDDYRKEVQTFIEYLKSQIKDKQYVLPFDLTDIYPHSLPRDMRDFKHLIQLIFCVTALHAKQRLILVYNKQEYFVSSLTDVQLAYEKFKAISETTRTGLSQHTLDFYHKVVVHMPLQEEKDKEGKKTEKPRPWKTAELVNQYNMAFSPKRSRRTILRYLEVLEEVGYVTSNQDGDDKKSFTFSALMRDSEENHALQDFSDLSQTLKSKLEKSFKSWLTRLGQSCGFYLETNNNEPVWLPWAEVEKLVFNPKAYECHDDEKAETSPKTALVLKVRDNQGKAQNAQLNETMIEKGLLIPCPHCKAQGRLNYFASDLDLATHVSTHHSGSSPEYVR